MIFKELVDKYQFKDIKDRFLKIYPDQKKCMKGYESVLNKLKTIKPAKRKDNLRIVVSWIKPYKSKKYKINDKNGYYEVNGADELKNKEWSGYFAIEFTPWKYWLSMPIDATTVYEFCDTTNDLNKNKEMDILIYCLWEMTFTGFEEKEVQNHVKELNRRIKNVKKNTKKYTEPYDATKI